MRALTKNVFYRRFLTIGEYEQDEGFRELLRSIARKGLFLYGLLGVIIVIVYVSSHLLLISKTGTWSLSGIDPATELWMPDKLLIFLLCLSLMPLSRTAISLNRIRLLVLLFVWVICMAMVMEDIFTQDVSFTMAYTTMALIIAVVSAPYKGWHTALFIGWVVLTTFLEVEFVPELMGIPPLELNLPKIIFISVIAVLLTGVSSQLYLNRYAQYRARKRAEALKDRLQERAHVLEMLREESEKQAQQILENEKLKDRFFTNISHEFRTPLTLMLGPLRDLLPDSEEEGTEAGEKKEVKAGTLRLMKKNAGQLLQLINQLLDLSKVDSGGIPLNKEPLDLGKLVDEAVLSFAPMAERKKIDLDCNMDGDTVTVRADAAQMERAISNLLSNALKFTPEGGEVTVSVNRTGTAEGGVEIRVADTGPGIEADELPHVFDRFFQASSSAGTFDKGTGIGLALVKEIAERHGGTVHVESEPGQGSEFIINLYDVDAETEAMETAVADSQGVEGNETVILDEDDDIEPAEDAPVVVLIDDNPDILAWLQPHLSSRYRVIALEGSGEALETIRREQADLVISDVMMPGTGGFELCRLLKEDPDLNHIPVILLTAQAGEEHRIEGLESGADDYIGKPFSASELMARAENLIELRRSLREKYSGQVRLKGKKVDVSSAEARFLQRVQSVIEEHLENSNFSVDWLAGEVNLSPRQLQRKLRSIADLSAGGYIRMIRLERARQLLEQEWGNVSEIAYKVGFQDTKYFSKLFKQTFGQNPSEISRETAEGRGQT